MRLIDANEIEELFYNQIMNEYKNCKYAADCGHRKTVGECPFLCALYVPKNMEIVVRCKDCKHLIFSDMYGECGRGYLGIVRPNDFCSYGERKEE